jgi:RluA family pseudouridine synthase
LPLPRCGATVLVMSAPRQPSRKHQPPGLEILHEDRDLLVVDKTAGLLTISTGRDPGRTAYAGLTDYVRKGNPKSPHRVFIVHRLDRDTSGLLVFARSETAKRRLQDNWETVEKRYLAVVEGHPPKEQDTLSTWLVENTAGRVYSSPAPGTGKLSHTRYRVLRHIGSRALLEIDLLTGRKNQIRVHLADLGCPIVGDIKYGGAARSAKRLALHACRLAFAHPFDGRPMVFETPPPASFLALARSPPAAAPAAKPANPGPAKPRKPAPPRR